MKDAFVGDGVHHRLHLAEEFGRFGLIASCNGFFDVFNDSAVFGTQRGVRGVHDVAPRQDHDVLDLVDMADRGDIEPRRVARARRDRRTCTSTSLPPAVTRRTVLTGP